MAVSVPGGLGVFWGRCSLFFLLSSVRRQLEAGLLGKHGSMRAVRGDKERRRADWGRTG
jgi:hypothetical protein